jgi:uncharacterized protein YycO
MPDREDKQEFVTKRASIEQESVVGDHDLQTGDIVFQISQSGQTKAIQLATHSEYSHVGVLWVENDEVKVLEAVEPVKITTFETWKQLGENQHYVLKRLKDTKQLYLLQQSELQAKWKNIARKYIGKHYDLAFAWSDEKMYCSELVWKMYKECLDIELCKKRKLKDFDLTHSIVKTQLAQRYEKQIPLEESVVSPADIFNSDLLKTIQMVNHKP